MERSYRNLIAWQKAMDLVTEIYGVTSDWPREEQFGLVNQVRRAAVSIPANIAEGQGRTRTREAFHHASIAYGSLCEAATHLLIAQRLNYIGDGALAPVMRQTAEAGRLLQGLLRSLR